MKKINRKRLNNKGFTLIELLAVVVILGVVMGIAMTNVLSSMNKARGGSLSDTTAVIVNAFNQKYTESLVGGIPSNVYNDVPNFVGYDFTVDSTYKLDTLLADEFNISESAYKLTGSSTSNVRPTNGTLAVDSSFVAYDADNGKFLVCMVAESTGNVYVAGFAVGGAQAKKGEDDKPLTSRTVTFDGVDYTFGEKVMFSCSDGTTSW